MVAPPLSTLHLKSSPAAPLFRFASSPRPLVPRLRGFRRPGASRSPLGAPPLSFKSRMQPESSRPRSLRWTLLRTSRTVVRWSLSALSPSHSAATWPGMVLSTSSPSLICSRSLATLSFPSGSTHGPPPPRGRQERCHSREGGNPFPHQPVTERKTGHRGNGWHTLCTIDGGGVFNPAACVRRVLGTKQSS